MKTQLIFPTLLMVLDAGASLVYFAKGDVKHGIYWIAALVLTACVTF